MHVVLRRMSDDYDPDHACYWMPKLDDMPTLCKECAIEQSSDLYQELSEKLPRPVLNKISGVYTYGIAPPRKGQVQEEDGIALVHAVLSCYSKTTPTSKNEIKNELYSAPARFWTEPPAQVVSGLRGRLKEANRLCVKIEWDMFGEKVVSILSERYTVFAMNLSKYGPEGEAFLNWSDKEDSAGLVDELLNAIETSCTQLENAQEKLGKSKKSVWSANQTSISDPKLRKKFEDRALDGKGKRWIETNDEKIGERPRKLQRMHKSTMRCERIGCNENVHETWQVVCGKCLKEAKENGRVQCLGRDRYFYPNNHLTQKKRYRGDNGGRDDDGKRATMKRKREDDRDVSFARSKKKMRAFAAEILAAERERVQKEAKEVGSVDVTETQARISEQRKVFDKLGIKYLT